VRSKVKGQDLDAFFDGSKTDRDDFEDMLYRRRRRLGGVITTDLIVRYLNILMELQIKEMKRFRALEDTEKFARAKERMHFAENMLLWIGKNV
jgi:hypothetical protein